MQRRIKREDYNIEELWGKAALDLEVDQYSSFVTKQLDKIKKGQKKKYETWSFLDQKRINQAILAPQREEWMPRNIPTLLR